MPDKKSVFTALGLIVLAALIWAGQFYYENLRGAKYAVLPPADDIKEAINETDLPLNIPAGFKMEIFARDVPGARMLAGGTRGLYVSQTSAGKISVISGVGENQKTETVLSGLRRPHGIVVETRENGPDLLYVAEEDKIVKYDENLKGVKIADLPAGGGHFTRTLKQGPDGRLYVSIGSSCNVCNESDDRRAKIFSLNKDGSNFKEFARGLRNTVFFVWSYIDGKMWGTDMGRDLLGDNLPPDEINVIEEGKNYGWPICYGQNIHDSNFDKNTYIRNPCMEPLETPAKVDLQAHSAPLGLAFIPEEGWPEEYWHDLVVAFHGSWNRTEPTGYKVVRIKLNDKGNYEGTEDFITGWLTPGREVLGRPVDIMVQPGGIMYISDDKAGVIYRLTVTPR